MPFRTQRARFLLNYKLYGSKQKAKSFCNFFKIMLDISCFCVIIAFVESRNLNKNRISGCGAVGSALDWGSRGREFKSRHSDHIKEG